MQETSTLWKQLFAAGADKRFRVTINGHGYERNKIVSLSSSNALMRDSLSVGNCVSQELTLTLVDPGEIPRNAEIKVYVRLYNTEGTPATPPLWAIRSGSRYEAASQYAESGTTTAIMSIYKVEIIGNQAFFQFIDGYGYPRYKTDRSNVYSGLSSEEIQKGVFYIDTREIDEEDNTITLHAFDAMLKTEQPYCQPGDQAEWWIKKGVTYTPSSGGTSLVTSENARVYHVSLSNGVATFRFVNALAADQFRTSTSSIYSWPIKDVNAVKTICSRIGVPLDPDTEALLSNDYDIQYPGITLEDGTPEYNSDATYSMREVLGYIGGMYGGNWCINDTGKMKLVQIKYAQPRPDLNNSLRFEAYGSITLEALGGKSWDGVLYWTDGEQAWAEWDGSEITGTSGTLYVRGTNNTYITNDQYGFGMHNWRTTAPGSESTRCYGNIECLLDYETVAAGNHPIMAAYAFSYLFDGNDTMTIPPALGAVTLSANCYEGIYANCYNLERMSALKAETLADMCYAFMYFSDYGIMVSETQSDTYSVPFRIPQTGTGIEGEDSLIGMLQNTVGEYSDDPEINVTYYTTAELVE